MAYIYDSYGFPDTANGENLTSDGNYNSNCTINGLDGLLNWGLILEKDSIGALMAYAPLKNTLENDMPTSDGVELYDNAKVNKRTLSLSFILVASSEAEYLTRYNSLQSVLFGGRLTLRVPRINMKFRLSYKQCSTYRAWFNGISKLIITVVEPDPTNRD